MYRTFKTYLTRLAGTSFPLSMMFSSQFQTLVFNLNSPIVDSFPCRNTLKKWSLIFPKKKRIMSLQLEKQWKTIQKFRCMIFRSRNDTGINEKEIYLQSWKKLTDFGACSYFPRSFIPREQKEKRERKSERAIELLSTLVIYLVSMLYFFKFCTVSCYYSNNLLHRIRRISSNRVSIGTESR
jgi:hypothetical protein